MVSERRWFKTTEQQRCAHLHKVASAVVKPSCFSSTFVTHTFENVHVGSPCPSAPHIPEEDSCSQPTDETPQQLSITVASVAEDAQPCLQGIWQKAQELLNMPGSITPAPGNSTTARMVFGRSGQRPHVVTSCKDGKFKCDSDCVKFRSLGICTHSVAVAEINRQLSEFVTAFKKTMKKPNFTRLATHGMPSGRGKKGTQPPRKRKRNISPNLKSVQIASQTAPNQDMATAQMPSL